MISLVLIAVLAQSQLPAGAVSPLAPETPKLQQAETLLEKGDYAKARDLLLPLVQQDTKDARAAYDLGVANEALGDTDKAAAAYLVSSVRDRNLFEPRLALGMILARRGEIAHARGYFAEATRLTPADGDKTLVAQAWRGLAHLDAGIAPERAGTELLEALKLSPETKDDQLLAADLASRIGNSADAVVAYKRALTIEANDPQAAAGLARDLIVQNKFDEAETLLTQAIAKDPANIVLAAQLASVYTHKGDTSKAIAVLETVYKQHPDEPSTSRMLADLYVSNGRPVDAIPMYEMLLTTPLFRDNPILLDDYGNALIRANRSADAERALTKALNYAQGAAQPNAADAPSKQQMAAIASHLAFAATANKDPETTLRALAVRDSIQAPTASSLFLAATAHDRLHHTKLAIELYRQFLKEAAGHYPNEEWEARHRLPVLERGK